MHRFDLSAMTYAGSGVLMALVPGRPNDFHISAAGDNLRLVTTQRTNDSNDSQITAFTYYSWMQRTKSLILGQLPNSARPDEIGKPNEDLRCDLSTTGTISHL